MVSFSGSVQQVSIPTLFRHTAVSANLMVSGRCPRSQKGAMNVADTLQFAVESAHSIARDEFDEQGFAERLSVLFDADGGVGVTSMRHAVPEPQIRVVVGGGPACSEATAASATLFAAKHPGILAQQRLGTARAVRVSDEVNLDRFWTTETWWVMHHPWNGRYSLGATLHLGRDAVVFVGLNRAKRDFSDDEVLALSRFQQPVVAAFRYRRAVQGALHQLAALADSGSPKDTERGQVRGAREAPSRREAEVLTLMAVGWTNTQIASRLFITERTVRKHLSSVYEKAGLPGRAAAAAWWERQRDLP